jgi:hypothetical protein
LLLKLLLLKPRLEKPFAIAGAVCETNIKTERIRTKNLLLNILPPEKRNLFHKAYSL